MALWSHPHLNLNSLALKSDQIIRLNFQAFLRPFVGFSLKKMMTLFVFAQIANTLET
jgi:hypothetical protein